MLPRICMWLGLGLISTAAQAAPEIAQLYAPGLPEGSAWVRVVNPADSTVQVRVAQGATVALSARSVVASPFQVVDARQPLRMTVDGRAIEGLKVPKDAWVTLVLDSAAGAAPKVIIDPQPRGKDLRAELNVYNLNAACEKAEVRLANGSSVFSQLPLKGQAQRTINPVQATLIANCGQSASLPLKLEPFKAGDRYSLFLVGSGQAPRLTGLVDQTAP